MERTKLELKVHRKTIIVVSNPTRIVAETSSSHLSEKEAEANAEHLVHCWNAFESGGLVDELVKACEKVMERFSIIAANGGSLQDFLKAGSMAEIAKALTGTKEVT